MSATDRTFERQTIEEAAARWRDLVGELPPHRLGAGGDHGDTGEALAPLYTSADVDLDEVDDLGVPGSAPFVRGAYPSGYVKRPWLMVQYAGFATVEETNERWKSLISAGQRAVSLAFDLPSHLGYDSDDDLAFDEVGKAGVAIDSLADFEVLFDGIDLSRIPATFNTAAIAPIITAMYRVAGERQGLSADQLMGTITNDNLSAAFRGTSVFPSEAGLKLVVDVIEHCTKEMPKFTPVNVQGVYMRSVGATKAQEVGYAMAFALAYLEEALARGLDVDTIAPRFSFFFQCDSHFFEEAAKFRAARKVWAELVRERFGTQQRESRLMRQTGVSAARCFTKEEPEINLIRGAYSALGCALGGVQGMWISSYDEAYATPTARASRFALRTMQILAEETGVRATVDPLGGGYYVEHLTKLMGKMMHEHVAEVDEHGGAVAATASGYLRQRMLENDLRWAHERETGERPIIGHNTYRLDDGSESHEVEFQRFSDDVRDDQVQRLVDVRARRDAGEVEQTLAAVRGAAHGGENVMPAIVDAVRAYATVGEIMNELRAEYGEWVEPVI
jgi:methylmalonyl-CoA mutase N-terminal domain/subunit